MNKQLQLMVLVFGLSLLSFEALAEDYVNLTGSFRMNYTVQDWNEAQKNRGGDFGFNQINLGVEAKHKEVRLSSSYRWYDNGNPSMIHHLYFATDIDEYSEVQVGLTKVPFGIQPYEGHSDWGNNFLFMGFNDDYDSGITYITQQEKLNIQVAYFAAGDTRNASDAQRFSADLVTTDDDATTANEEAHQANVHMAYDLSGLEIGGSLQLSGLYNNVTEKMGHAYAVAAFVNGEAGPIQVQAQAARYEFNPRNGGADEKTVQYGTFGTTYDVAAKANMYVLNLAYPLPLQGGIVDSILLFNDFSMLRKDASGFENSYVNTLGLQVATGNLYTNFDITSGRNALLIGDGEYTTALAQGDGQGGWNTFFNIQMGYYF